MGLNEDVFVLLMLICAYKCAIHLQSANKCSTNIFLSVICESIVAVLFVDVMSSFSTWKARYF